MEEILETFDNVLSDKMANRSGTNEQHDMLLNFY